MDHTKPQGLVRVGRVLNPKNDNSIWGIYLDDNHYYETDHLAMIKATCKIDRELQERSKVFSTKSFHAWIEGIIVRSDYPIPMPGDGWKHIYYTVKQELFYYFNWEGQIGYIDDDMRYEYAIFNSQGQVWIYT